MYKEAGSITGKNALACFVVFLEEEDFGCKYTPKQGGKNCDPCKTALDAKDEHTDVFSIELYHVFIKEPSV